MEQKKRHRKVLRAAFTKAANELYDMLKSQDRNEEYLRQMQVVWELLISKHDLLKTLDGEVCEALLEVDATEAELLSEMESCDNYEKKFTDLRLRFENVLLMAGDKKSEGSEVNSSTSATAKRKFKLPTIELKKFNGDIRDWLPFWAQFKKVHEDPSIDLNDKIAYLIQATVSGSRARELVESFPAVGENYEKVIDSLRSRFGREDLQIEVYVRELLKLILNNALSKNKMDLSTLYDKIETQLRALETLGITSDKCSAMLFPLIESCLPEDLLRVWQRVGRHISATEQVNDQNSSESLELSLKDLMRFLKGEVENEQRISLAAEGFGLTSGSTLPHNRRSKLMVTDTPTAAGLVNLEKGNCLFCDGSHDSETCFKAQKMTLDHKRGILTKKRACFRCLKRGHQSKRCRGRLQCIVCSKPHVTLMCPDLPVNKKDSEQTEPVVCAKIDSVTAEQTLTNNTSGYVFLETLRVTINDQRGSRNVRALIDSGSQRSYILTSTARHLGLISKHKERIRHCLFGGGEQEQGHDCFDIQVCHSNFSCTLEVLDQSMICKNISPVFYGPWIEELKSLQIQLEDTRGDGPIELLIGSDVCGNLYTGKRHILQSGLIAIETYLGWTISGKIHSKTCSYQNSASMFTFSLLNEMCISDLWKLDVLGITEPSEKKSREEMALAAQEHFLETVKVDKEGRYEVRLPWLAEHPPLSSNYNVSKKRLETTVQKLRKENLFVAYKQIFNQWLDDSIIEEVPANERESKSHYLPHRPVIKESSATTKIRPVFDASARERGQPSLNHCLEKGLNLIELIPSILMRFREYEYGVTSDICKAFLQISIHEKDRDFLRFLWMDTEDKVKLYRHRRVVFGLKSSPFLLGATIEYHLSQVLEKCEQPGSPYTRDVIQNLSKSFYVDNCVTSLHSKETLDQFIKESSLIMMEGKFDLRGWEYTHSTQENRTISILGLKWNPARDTLAINNGSLENPLDIENNTITKRLILSIAQRLFDPIGFICPATLTPKLLLQRTWEQQLSWDKPVASDIEHAFLSWVKELPFLFKIEIRRWVGIVPEDDLGKSSLHTFCDASKNAYAAVVFLRLENNNVVSVRLLSAKARIAPLKKMTIPRLELMAATIGARLCKQVQDSLNHKIETVYWSDSTTVISWISRRDDWSPFVGNRVSEINVLTSSESWRHVSGTLNPADLPSRGCSAKYLLESRWWEGPGWLYKPANQWVQGHFVCDEEEINKERKKRSVICLFNFDAEDWHLYYFSSYTKIIRMMAWIFRFIHNVKKSSERHQGSLTTEEINQAEMFVFKLIQQEVFHDENDKRISALSPFKDESGVIRLKSRVSNREDHDSFRFPVVLPGEHEVVKNLILDSHRRSCHVGTQGLLSILREKYWILGGRRSVRSVITKCVVCKRHHAKPPVVTPPPLPLDRVRNSAVFEVTGIDFAGPLYLKTGEKAWVCLFTCAVYRAVHLELTTSLSTISFMQAFRRFVARRGRPRIVYSDNGTNFVGTENAFSKLNWERIVEETSIQRIIWRFNPPAAPWWGGFWERLVGVLKPLLRKVLGRASLYYEELITLLCDCEAIINSRPLTYMSNDPSDLIALTPAMFLRDQVESGMPDCDAVDRESLSRKMRHKQKLRQDLQQRFRSEYLGQLKLMCNRNQTQHVRLGEVVLIGSDNRKRLDWPLGRISEIILGKDGLVRLVKVDTKDGQLLRPLQRIYQLECISPEVITESSLVEETEPSGKTPRTSNDEDRELDISEVSPQEEGHDVSDSAGVSNVKSDIKSRVPVQVKITRCGRTSKIPLRFL